MSRTTHGTSFLALSCVGAMAFTTAAHAQDAQQPARKLGGMTVTDTAIDEPTVKVERADNPKYTAPLADTPQTITVISRKSIEQQNLLTLREVLSTVPGITFGAGEGGFGYGDRITMLGQDAKNDVTVDGVRSGSFGNRNETYNIEQVEVTTGANSVYNGGGSVAGTINLVTKKPLADTRIIANAGVGTDNYWRGTIDANYRISDIVAARLNAVYHQNDVPGRDVEFYDRWGVAPSVTIGIESPTSLTLQYEHLEDHGMPQYGIRYFPQISGYFVDGFNDAGYYGFRNVDKQNSTTDSVQGIITHEFSDKIRIRNLSRYENISQDTVTSQPAGNFCLPNGTAAGYNPGGGACVAATAGAGSTGIIPPGFWQPTGGRGNQRFIRNETLYDQFDVIGTFNTGSFEHSFVLGASYLWEKYRQTSGNVLRNADGSNPFPNGFALANIANPNDVVQGPAGFTYGSNVYTGPVNFIRGSQANGGQESFAAYLFDTVKFADWLQFNGGIRYEHMTGDSYTYSYDTTAGSATLGQVTAATANAAANPPSISNDLFSYRAGLVFKPTEQLSFYVSHGTSKLPSKGSVDGSCVAPAAGVANSNCTLKPETTNTYEVGVKANLFNNGLLLTAAAFRNDRDTIKVASGDPTVPDQAVDGKQRSQGISLGASGTIGNFTIQANYMYLDAYVRQSVSDKCIAQPGSTGCTNSAAFPDPLKGSPLTNAPEHSGSAFATYRFPFGLQVGYGVTYQGSFALNQYNLTTPTAILYRVPSYTTQRLMVSYTINDHLTAQVNVQNLFDENYVTTVRNALTSSWAQPGPARQAVFSLTGTF